MEIHNVIIIGGGCAGLSAAVYCARADLSPLLFASNLEEKGGLLSKTSTVENYPGFQDGIWGFDLVQNMEAQAVKYGAKVLDKKIKKIYAHMKPFLIVDEDDNQYITKSIIIATGSNPNKLYLENENNLWAKGISSCAVCDGALYKNKRIIVTGGGDSAIEEANFLTKFSDVTLIHRRDTFRASKIMQQKLTENSKISVIYDTIITNLHGSDKLQSITCRNLKTDETFDLNVDGLFYGLGLTPNSQLFQEYKNFTKDGYIIKNPDSEYETATMIDGIFVAGDVADKIYRQAIVAAGDGCKAALDVNSWLNLPSTGQ